MTHRPNLRIWRGRYSSILALGMAAVAEGFVFARFAAAPGHLFFFRDLDEHGPHARGAVGAVAKGLFLALPTGTPDIAARFGGHDKGVVIVAHRALLLSVFLSGP